MPSAAGSVTRIEGSGAACPTGMLPNITARGRSDEARWGITPKFLVSLGDAHRGPGSWQLVGRVF